MCIVQVVQTFVYSFLLLPVGLLCINAKRSGFFQVGLLFFLLLRSVSIHHEYTNANIDL